MPDKATERSLGTPTERPSRARQAATWSAEVQGLRAVAVGLVVLFHLWPHRVPGGYIGVDVFFVISGFLITGHLLRDLDAGTFRLATFYARRARRLLPASLLVLGVSMLGALLLQPSLVWVQTAQQVLASATYVQNWVLAAQHVDYLNPEISPTAVQHFWSLSVEEQFYLIWPVTLMIAAGGWTRRRRSRAASGSAPDAQGDDARSAGPSRSRSIAVIAVMAVLFAVSFGYAVRVTSSSVEGAYFFSTARVWQFAAGGLLAALTLARSGRRTTDVLTETTDAPRQRWRSLVRGAVSWAGFGLIAVTGFRFTAETPVPGWPALLPVAGTLAVIAAGRVESSWSPSYLVQFGPTQWLGRVSYSLYLWHWPLIVLAPAVLDRTSLRTKDKIVLLLLSLLLAGLTKQFVEDRFLAKPRAAMVGPSDSPARSEPRGRRRFRPSVPVVVILVTMLVVVGLAGATWRTTVDRGRTAQALADRALAARTPCFGAEAILNADLCLAGGGSGETRTGFVADGPFGNAVTPTPANAATEIQRTSVWQNCFHTRTPSCSFGPADADVHIVLFGDSHALQWFPAVREVARTKGWRITTYLKAACPPNPAPMKSKESARDRACQRWAEKSLAAIEATPDVDAVIVTAFNSKKWEPDGDLDSYDAGVAGYQKSWQHLLDSGVKHVIAIRDTPRPRRDGIECVDASDVGGAGCRRSRDAATHRTDNWHDRLDPLQSAVEGMRQDDVGLIDMTDAFCGTGSCPAVIGNVLVYIDDDHISPTYARTLTPALERQLMARMG